MIDDKNKGIANLLAEYRPPVRTPKGEPQEDPIISLSETLMRIEPLSLPKSSEPKDEYGYTKKQNREIEKHLTRDTSKSKGAWSAFVKANTDPNRPKNIEPVNYMEQMKSKHGSYNNYTKNLVKYGVENSSKKIGTAPQGSKQQKTDVMNYVNKMTEIYDGPKISDQPILKNNINSKRYVNKSLNSFENRTDKKDVVTFDPTTQLFTDQTRNIAFKDYHKAKRWNDAINSEDKKDTRKNENVKKINPNRRLI